MGKPRKHSEHIISFISWVSGELLLELLLGALNDDSSEIRAYATFMLRELGDNRAVPTLINLLNDNNSEVVLEAAIALGKLGDKSTVPHLVNVLNHDWDEVQKAAAKALGRLGDKSAIPGLIEIIGNDNQDMYFKFEAMKALVKLSQSTSQTGE